MGLFKTRKAVEPKKNNPYAHNYNHEQERKFIYHEYTDRNGAVGQLHTQYSPNISKAEPGRATYHKMLLIKKELEAARNHLHIKSPEMDKQMIERIEFVIDDCENMLSEIYELVCPKEF